MFAHEQGKKVIWLRIHYRFSRKVRDLFKTRLTIKMKIYFCAKLENSCLVKLIPWDELLLA